MTDFAAIPEPLPVRVVGDADTLKALSDPLRVSILRVLMAGPPDRPRVMSVKELAEELGEPQTKLYRHVKQLADRDLVHVAETRIVSGIVEQRYRTGQLSLDFDPGFLGRHVADDETTEAIGATLDDFRDQLLAAIRAGRIGFDVDAIPPGEDYRKMIVARGFAAVPAAKAAEFRERFGALMHEMVDSDYDHDGVRIYFLGAFYVPTEPANP